MQISDDLIDLLSLKGKKALVTGGGRGIGKAIVEVFMRAGADVAYISSSNSPYREELEALASEHGVQLCAYAANLAVEEEVDATLKVVAKEFGHVDILVNNAGITRDGLLFGMKSQQWQEVINVNLTSAFYLSKILGRQMALKKKGCIINLSSVVGITGNAGQANYAASKAGMIGLSKSVARELASRNVRVNVIAPGFIDTDMTGKLNEKQRQGVLKEIPLGRMGNPEEIGRVALFLASDLATYITGQVLTVDGGMLT